MKRLGIRRNDEIVIYDKQNLRSSPRAYWMLKAYGAPNVSILNGSYKKWEAEGRETASGDSPDAWVKEVKDARDEDFAFVRDEKLIVAFEQLEGIKHDIIDAREMEEHALGAVKGAK